MKIKVLIVDDEKHARESLSLLMEQIDVDFEVVGEAAELKTARELLSKEEPQLVFLDIELSGESGFDLLAELPADTAVIFVTAYNEYAIKAFRSKALDYLLKPVDPDELQDAVHRAVEQLSKPISRSEFKDLVKSFSRGESFSGIAIPCKGGTEILDAGDILRLESESNYTNIFTVDGRQLLVTKTLKDVERMLPEGSFFRIHHSHIANLRQIRKLWREDGAVAVEMKDGSKLPVARSRKEEFLSIFR